MIGLLIQTTTRSWIVLLMLGLVAGPLSGRTWKNEAGAEIEAELDTYDPAALAELKGSLDESVAVMKSLRASTDAYELYSEELLPMLRDLLRITAKLRDVDGTALRQFMQIEGTKSNWDRTPEDVRGRLKKLGVGMPGDDE